jgi:hypothetical protein
VFDVCGFDGCLGAVDAGFDLRGMLGLYRVLRVLVVVHVFGFRHSGIGCDNDKKLEYNVMYDLPHSQ